ncbi:hypothetical protein [Arenimonas alkanexedens]
MSALRPWLATLVLSLSLAAPTTMAQVFPVDDSRSQVLGSTMQLRWDQAAPRDGRAGTLSGTITVLVQLDVREWRGKRARIYQTLPSRVGANVIASWTTQGGMLPGQLRNGDRTLVYAGPIDVDFLQDTFRLNIQADGDSLDRSDTLRFAFEIELESI